jgi:DNA repair exonuclease SbcCD ATPase subunit
MQRAQLAVTHEADWSSYNTQRLGLQQQLAEATSTLDSAKVRQINANIADAQGKLAQGWAKISISQQNANTRVQSLENAVRSKNQALAQTSLKSADDAVTGMQRDVTAAETALTNAYANNVDPAVIQQYADNLKKAQDALGTVKTRYETLHDLVAHNDPAAQAIRGASGASSVTVTTQGSPGPGWKLQQNASGQRRWFNPATGDSKPAP